MVRTFRLRCCFVLGVVFLTATAAGCAARPPGAAAPRAADGSPKLNPFVYFEDGAVAFIGVDGRAAQYVGSERIFPLGFCVANRTTRSLSLTRESFILEDESRKQYAPASYRDFASGYGRAETDVRLSDSFVEMMQLRFGGFTFAPWPLYPVKGGTATMRDRLELGRNQYTIGHLYFPVPEGGVHGRSFTLLVKAGELPETLVVSFRVR
jgi:hypothetical protein